MKHDKIILDAILEHFSWNFHLEDIILNNYEYILDDFSLSMKQYNDLVLVKKRKLWQYNKEDNTYHRYNVRGEMDFACISPKHNYALIGEVKSRDSNKNKTKALYQIIKDSQYIRSKYGIDRYFGFYLTTGKKDNTYTIERLL